MSEQAESAVALSDDERVLLDVLAAAQRPVPVTLVLDVVHPLPAGWAKLRLFKQGNPWHRRSDALQAVIEGLAERGLLLRTRTRRLRLDGEYEITDDGWWAVFEATDAVRKES
jgi:hypothetical protein